MKSNIFCLFKVFLIWVSMDFLKNCLGMKGKLRSEIKNSNAAHIKNTNKALLIIVILKIQDPLLIVFPLNLYLQKGV